MRPAQAKKYSMPLVSIVMPCYNVANVLPYALISLKKLEYDNFELIAIDDGSVDRTGEILQSDTSLNIKYVRNRENLGLSKSLNVGLAHSSGEFIARFDADDFMYSYRLRDQVFHLLKNSEIDVLGSGVDTFGEVGSTWRVPRWHAEIRGNILVQVPMLHPTVMIRRALLDSGDFIYNEEFQGDEDYDLWLRLIDRYRFENLDYSTIQYRVHKNNFHKKPHYRNFKTAALYKYFLNKGKTNILGYTIEMVVESLVNYQMSGYILYEEYDILRTYSIFADLYDYPRLGWMQKSLHQNKTYSSFMEKHYR